MRTTMHKNGSDPMKNKTQTAANKSEKRGAFVNKRESTSISCKVIRVTILLLLNLNMDEFRSDYESVLAQSVAPSTRTQYERSWKTFQAFCETHTMNPLGNYAMKKYETYVLNTYVLRVTECSADGILGYLSHLRNKHSGGVSTAQTHMSAIAYHYRLNGRTSISEDPRIAMYMK